MRFYFLSSRRYSAVEIVIRRHMVQLARQTSTINYSIVFDEREYAMCSAEFFRVWNKKFQIYVFISLSFCYFSFFINILLVNFVDVNINVAAILFVTINIV